MGISGRGGGAEESVLWNSKFWWAVGYGKGKESGQGRRPEREVGNATHKPTASHLCSRLYFFFSLLKHQMETGFSSRGEKSPKTSGSHLLCWDGWEVRGRGWGNSPCSSGSRLIRKWEDLLPWGNLQRSGEFNCAWGGRSESSVALWSVRQEKAKSADFWKPLGFFVFVFCFCFFLNLFIYFWVCWVFISVRAFSSCGERGPLFIAVRGPLTVAASLVAEHRLQTRRLSSCGSRA